MIAFYFPSNQYPHHLSILHYKLRWSSIPPSQEAIYFVTTRIYFHAAEPQNPRTVYQNQPVTLLETEMVCTAGHAGQSV
jgi:hypothetical protein